MKTSHFLQRSKRRVILWLLKQLRCTGKVVRWEKTLPTEFIISKHAGERLRERFSSMVLESYEDAVKRAWYSTYDLPRYFKPKDTPPKPGYNQVVYRYFMGHVWVFGIRKKMPRMPYPVKMLITIYPPMMP